MVRGSLGGRLSHELAGRHTYTEGGLGVAFHEITAPADGPYSGSARVARSATSACFQLSSGVTSDPVQRPGFIIEGQWVLSTGEDAPSVLLGRVGILF